MRANPTFVVEYKSKRRTLLKTTSIWGDTDLKALTRDVLQDKGWTEPAGASLHSATESVVSDFAMQISLESQTVDPQIVPDEPAPEAAKRLSQEGDAQTICLTPANREIVESAVQVRRPRNARKPNLQTAIAVEQDLETVVAENRRLKLMLRKKLFEENVRLKQLLDRF